MDVCLLCAAGDDGTWSGEEYFVGEDGSVG